MSNEALAWAYKLPIKGPAKPVLTALADFADEAGSCYPGQEKLALMSGLSIRSVRRALERLEDQGLLRREHRYDHRGYRTSDRYFLSMDVQVLPVTLTSGQSDLRSDSPRLPVTLSTPTGQSDRVTISRTLRKNPQGGASAPPPVDNSDQEPPQRCPRHIGMDIAPRCGQCKDARKTHEAWEQRPQPRVSKYDPAVFCEHLNLIGQCETCTIEQARAAAILNERFGDTA